MDTFGERYNAAVAAELRAARARKKVTIDELVEATGLSLASVKRYLSAERDIPVPAFANIARVLGVDPGEVADLAFKHLTEDD
ncbi:helix-turn-helix domain-containing protein [Agromyces sp. SYSU T00194]|uniref:helix-turn-helix domain-containing protein n=1 Tax=Agromyces chitinivorans TaxID=3158560 RepID=UPI0033925D90